MQAGSAVPARMAAAYQRPDEGISGGMVAELGSAATPSLAGMPPGAVLVRVLVTSICGSDLAGRCCASCTAGAWRGYTDEMNPNTVARAGGTGHEVMGEVVSTVEPCRRAVGERVLAFTTGYIRMVPSARAAFEAATGVSADVMPLQGGFCQYILSFETATVPVPSSIPHAGFDPLHYVVAQPLGTIIRAVSKLGSLWGKRVAVLGCGQNGLLMTALLSRMGARVVVALDLFPHRVAAAGKMGATHTVLVEQPGPDGVDATLAEVGRITAGKWCDVVVDMVGHQGTTLDLCSDMAARDSTVLVFGLPPNSTDDTRGRSHTDMILRYKNLTKNLTYLTSHVGGDLHPMPMFEQAMEMLRDGRFPDLSPVITHRFSYQPGTNCAALRVWRFYAVAP